MLSVPLPFVVALLLLILLARLVGRAADRLFLALLGLAALLSVLIGLRWGYGITALLPLQSLLAAGWAPLAWVAFRRLAGPAPSPWPHLAAPAALLLLILLHPQAIGAMLVATDLAYGAALLHLARRGPDALSRVRLEEAGPIHRALQATGGTLLFFAAVELAVEADFALAGGRHAGLLVGLANLPALLGLGIAAAVAGRERAPEPPVEAPRREAEGAVLDELDAAMRTRGLYRDPDLTLERLARRTGIPARRISEAVNRAGRGNVSQFINGYRVAEACRLLAEGERPVTAVLFEAGFQTKSNFNREFRRVTGASPTEWRASQAAGTVPSSARTA